MMSASDSVAAFVMTVRRDTTAREPAKGQLGAESLPNAMDGGIRELGGATRRLAGGTTRSNSPS